MVFFFISISDDFGSFDIIFESYITISIKGSLYTFADSFFSLITYQLLSDISGLLIIFTPTLTVSTQFMAVATQLYAVSTQFLTLTTQLLAVATQLLAVATQ